MPREGKAVFPGTLPLFQKMGWRTIMAAIRMQIQVFALTFEGAWLLSIRSA
jgi:hypothetical protein